MIEKPMYKVFEDQQRLQADFARLDTKMKWQNNWIKENIELLAQWMEFGAASLKDGFITEDDYDVLLTRTLRLMKEAVINV